MNSMAILICGYLILSVAIPGIACILSLTFFIQWLHGKEIGKQMSILIIILACAAILSAEIYRFFGILDVFVLQDSYNTYFTWAFCGALLFSLLLRYMLPAKAWIYNQILTVFLFLFLLNQFVDPSLNLVKLNIEARQSKQDIEVLKSSNTVKWDKLLQNKTPQQKFEVYIGAAYDVTLSKKAFEFLTSQLGSPLNDEQGSTDYTKENYYYRFYYTPFFVAIKNKNYTALRAFAEFFRTSTPEQLKHYQETVYDSWNGMDEMFADLKLLFHENNIRSNDDVRVAELLLPVFPELAITREGKPIVDSTIQNADLRAMKLFARYSHPSSQVLTVAGDVLAGNTDKVMKALQATPSLLYQPITIGKFSSSSDNLLYYIIMLGKKETILAILPMINWRDSALYYNEGNSYILTHAAERVFGVLFGKSQETNEDAVAIFTLLLNAQLHGNPNVNYQQLWDITMDKFYINVGYGHDEQKLFATLAIRSICTSAIGAQYVDYVNSKANADNNEKVTSVANTVRKICRSPK